MKELNLPALGRQVLEDDSEEDEVDESSEEGGEDEEDEEDEGEEEEEEEDEGDDSQMSVEGAKEVQEPKAAASKQAPPYDNSKSTSKSNLVRCQVYCQISLPILHYRYSSQPLIGTTSCLHYLHESPPPNPTPKLLRRYKSEPNRYMPPNSLNMRNRTLRTS